MTSQTQREWGFFKRTAAVAKAVEQPSNVVSVRGYMPEYLNRELAKKAAERCVTKTFLIMEALAKTGYRVNNADLIADRRKVARG